MLAWFTLPARRARISLRYTTSWGEPRFRTYALPQDFEIGGYRGDRWCFGRPPGWAAISGCTLMELCAFQWRSYNEACLRDAKALGDRIRRVSYEDLCSDPGERLADIADWAGLSWSPLAKFSAGLPVVNTWSRPRRRNGCVWRARWRRYCRAYGRSRAPWRSGVLKR